MLLVLTWEVLPLCITCVWLRSEECCRRVRLEALLARMPDKAGWLAAARLEWAQRGWLPLEYRVIRNRLYGRCRTQDTSLQLPPHSGDQLPSGVTLIPC